MLGRGVTASGNAWGKPWCWLPYPFLTARQRARDCNRPSAQRVLTKCQCSQLGDGVARSKRMNDAQVCAAELRKRARLALESAECSRSLCDVWRELTGGQRSVADAFLDETHCYLVLSAP